MGKRAIEGNGIMGSEVGDGNIVTMEDYHVYPFILFTSGPLIVFVRHTWKGPLLPKVMVSSKSSFSTFFDFFIHVDL